MAIPWFDRQAMTFQATNPTNYVNSKAQLTKGYAVDDSIASGYAPRQAGILSLLGKSLTGIAAPFVGDTQWLQNETAQQLRQQQADQEFQALLMKNAMQKQALAQKKSSREGFAAEIKDMESKGYNKILYQTADGEYGARWQQDPQFKADLAVQTKVKSAAAANLNSAMQYSPTLIDLLNRSSNLPEANNVPEAMVRGFAATKLQTDPFVASYMQDLEANAPGINKFLGDTANIAVAEREVAKSLFPKTGNTTETNILKRAALANSIYAGTLSKIKNTGLDKEQYAGYVDTLKSLADSERLKAIKAGIPEKKLSEYLDNSMSKYLKKEANDTSNSGGNRAGKLNKDNLFDGL
jgi:hypothetical protein